MVKSILAASLLLIATSAAALMLLVTGANAHESMSAEHGDGSFQITVVNPGGPAAEAGLKVNDLLIMIDGKKLVAQEDLGRILDSYEPGDTVPFTVEREGETVELLLTFGKRSDGGVSVGVSIALTAMASDGGHMGNISAAEREAGTVGCLDWIEETYRVDSMIQDLDIDLDGAYQTARECVGDQQRIKRYCDNIFKVHCAGIDLLAEIAEAQVEHCEGQLEQSLGVTPGQYKSWKTCGQGRVFDSYSMNGDSSDSQACEAAFLDDCGTNIDTAVETAELSADQRDFVECCSANAIDTAGHHSDDCGMIDDGFSRGPCQDRAVCVNRLTTEWLHCSVVE